MDSKRLSGLRYSGMKVFSTNKKAHYLYEISEKFEAGMSLEGWEVRSIREGRLNLNQAHAKIKDGELWIIGSHIAPLPQSSESQDSTRDRKLLLKKKQILDIDRKIEPKGVTVVPLKAYQSRGRIKIEIAIGKGRTKADKRSRILEELDRRDAKESVKRAMKGSDY